MANDSLVHLRFELAGTVQLSRVLEGISGDLSDLRPAWERMAQEYRETRHGLFAREGSFEGEPAWDPLSPKYAEWKEQRYPDRPILVLTGETRASLTDASHPDHYFKAEPQEMAVGSVHKTPDGRWNLPLLHQLGTRNMPARPPGNLTQPEKGRWVSILHEWLWEDRAAWWVNKEMKDMDREFRRKSGL